MQLCKGYGTNPSDTFLFTDTTLDATDGRHALVIGKGFADVDFDGLDIVQPADDQACINFYGPSRVSIDGITAVGGSSLITRGTWPASYPNKCTMENGTYLGPEIGTVRGVTVSNVSLLE